MNKSVSIIIVVWDIESWGTQFLHPCLDSIKKQTYTDFDLTIVDNGSRDKTVELVRKELDQIGLSVSIIERSENPGLWQTWDQTLKDTKGEYVLFLSLDTKLDPTFLEQSITTFEQDKKIGALQAKVLAYDNTSVIDTTGFELHKSRRITNRGHGEKDTGQFEKQEDIFAVEGAVPIFRRTALEDCRIEGHIADPDYFWYSDDLEVTWRMQLLGWRHVYNPKMIAQHERGTTHDQAQKLTDHANRISRRKQISLQKRQLDWANTRFTRIKNDCIINVLWHLPWIVARETAVFVYTLFVEPGVLKAYPRFFRLLPQMLHRRKLIMARARRTAKEMRQWIK